MCASDVTESANAAKHIDHTPQHTQDSPQQNTQENTLQHTQNAPIELVAAQQAKLASQQNDDNTATVPPPHILDRDFAIGPLPDSLDNDSATVPPPPDSVDKHFHLASPQKLIPPIDTDKTENGIDNQDDEPIMAFHRTENQQTTVSPPPPPDDDDDVDDVVDDVDDDESLIDVTLGTGIATMNPQQQPANHTQLPDSLPLSHNQKNLLQHSQRLSSDDTQMLVADLCTSRPAKKIRASSSPQDTLPQSYERQSNFSGNATDTDMLLRNDGSSNFTNPDAHDNGNKKNSRNHNANHKNTDKKLSHFPPYLSSYISITSPLTGTRMYSSAPSKDSHDRSESRRNFQSKVNKYDKNTARSLFFAGLVREVADELQAERIREEERLLNGLTQDDSETLHNNEPSRTAPSQSTTQYDFSLWVDKYAPKKFVDLMGDSKTNREILGWFVKWKRFIQSDYGSDDDSSSLEPMILLAGAPGIGKTTLAHVLAAQTGFNPIDINASDLRSGPAFKTTVLNAASSRSISSDGSMRPNCIILDELDGAAGGASNTNAISILLALIKDKKSPICSPIIAICNDLYTRILRPLRAAVPVYTYDKSTQASFKSRLSYIADKEKIFAGLTGRNASVMRDRLLTEICSLSSGDIRCALNTMQFLRSIFDTSNSAMDKATGKTSPHNATDTLVGELLSVVGHKDTYGDVFQTWSKVFSKPRTAPSLALQRASGLYFEERKIDKIQRMRMELQSVNIEMTLSGCYENLLIVMRCSDPSLQRTVKCLDYHGLCDVMLGRSFGLMNSGFNATGYLECGVYQYHMQCGLGESSRRWILPTQGTSSRTQNQSVVNHVHEFLDRIKNGHIRGCESLRTSLTETIPYLSTILYRRFKSKKGAERKESNQEVIEVASLIREYGIEVEESKRLEYVVEGEKPCVWRFQPNLEVVSSIPATLNDFVVVEKTGNGGFFKSDPSSSSSSSSYLSMNGSCNTDREISNYYGRRGSVCEDIFVRKSDRMMKRQTMTEGLMESIRHELELRSIQERVPQGSCKLEDASTGNTTEPGKRKAGPGVLGSRSVGYEDIQKKLRSIFNQGESGTSTASKIHKFLV